MISAQETCNILGMTTSHLLTFEAFPERVLFEGFDREVLRGLGGFMARVRTGGADSAAYRVVAEGGARPRRAAVSGTGLKRRPFRRHLQRDGEDQIHMPGCTLRLAPGRTESFVDFPGTVADVDGYVLTTQIEMAISHALAMGGYVVNHAAAIEIDGAALLAVGPTHAGKSTLCGAALAAGGAVVSDDSVILGLDGAGAPSVGALRRNLWLREGSAGILPHELQSRLRRVVVFGEDRWGLDRDACCNRFRTRVRPNACVIVHRDRRMRGFELRGLSSADGLAGILMASTALFFSPRYGFERDRCLQGLVELVNSVPCFSLRMGTDLIHDAVETIQSLVAAVGE